MKNKAIEKMGEDEASQIWNNKDITQVKGGFNYEQTE